MATAKTITITKTRRGKESTQTGTLAELTEYYGHTLMSGNSYNPKINRTPTTAKGLVNALNKSVDELQSGSYNPDYYELTK